MSKRNALRSAILGSGAVFKTKTVEVGDESYEVKEPSKGTLQKLLSKSKDAEGQFDGMSLSVWAAIESTYVPGTDEKVFEEGDFETLNNLPISHPFNKIILAASELMNSEEDFEKK